MFSNCPWQEIAWVPFEAPTGSFFFELVYTLRTVGREFSFPWRDVGSRNVGGMGSSRIPPGTIHKTCKTSLSFYRRPRASIRYRPSLWEEEKKTGKYVLYQLELTPCFISYIYYNIFRFHENNTVPNIGVRFSFIVYRNFPELLFINTNVERSINFPLALLGENPQ